MIAAEVAPANAGHLSWGNYSVERPNPFPAVAKNIPWNKASIDVRQQDALLPSPKTLIGDALKSHIESINPDTCDVNAESSFFVVDLGEVYRQHMRWKKFLPRVEPFYAVKCNPDPKVIRLLSSLGAGFDCASHGEMNQVLRMGISPEKIIYANPCKAPSHVRYASDQGVKMMTFDNADELYKCKRECPDAKLFLRILTDDSNSLCRLGLKFGADLSITYDLLALAKELDLHIEGVSFHVGSGSYDPHAFIDAVERARHVFNQAAEVGYDLKTLDIGGGFSHDSFDGVASVLGPCIDHHFPSTVRVIAEPGRYYVAGAYTLATHIIARRVVEAGKDEPKKFLCTLWPICQNKTYKADYLNDGVYGSFNCTVFDHQHPRAEILTRRGEFLYGQTDNATANRGYDCSLWGPTCDSADCIDSATSLPQEVYVGDWLYFQNMGAYTSSAASQFNGFPNSPNIYVVSELGASELLRS